MKLTRFYAVYQQLHDKDNVLYDEFPVVIFDYQVDVANYFGISAQAVNHAISRNERIHWNDARYKVYAYTLEDNDFDDSSFDDLCMDVRLCQ